jgi:hypothetical protein
MLAELCICSSLRCVFALQRQEEIRKKKKEKRRRSIFPVGRTSKVVMCYKMLI